jgi:hypothetical protein
MLMVCTPISIRNWKKACRKSRSDMYSGLKHSSCFMKKTGTGKVRGIKEDKLIVTIDIGLEMNRGYCTTTDGRDIKPFRFDNTRAGLDRFWSMIVVNMNRFRCDDVIVGLINRSLC